MRFALLAAFLLVGTPVVQAAWDIVNHDGRRYVPIENVADFYKMSLPVKGGDGFRLTAQGRSIEGKVGGREVRINGVKYVLCFPIVPKGGRILISAMDVTKIIEPVLRPQKIKNSGAVRTVVLDAGHGGHDGGARGPLGSEKDAALDVVLRAKKLLEAGGYQVRLTRSGDTFIPLEQRAEFANRQPNSLFVSVHFNKSKGTSGTGIETYCLAPRGVPSMDEENLSYSDFKQHPGHACDAQNVALASVIHASLVRNLRLTDRGIKRARFVVIKNIKVPGILIEGGFMNNPVDSRMIATPAYRQMIAQAIFDGVNRYRSVVGGGPQAPRPSVEVTGPEAKPGPVGSQTNIDRTVAQATEALQSTMEN